MKQLLLLPLLLAALPLQAGEPAPVPHERTIQFYNIENALTRTLSVYRSLVSLTRYSDTAAIQSVSAHIRPHCERLRQLPPDQLKQVCLLADAILWQSKWIENTQSNTGCLLEDEEAQATGFELLKQQARELRHLLAGQNTRAATQELLSMLGGESALELPATLHQERWACDYATMAEFLQGFCQAAAADKDATALAMLAEQKKTLDYLMSGNEYNQLRVIYLTRIYQGTLRIHRHQLQPILPEERRSKTRMKALEPFFTILPELRDLIL